MVLVTVDISFCFIKYSREGSPNITVDVILTYLSAYSHCHPDINTVYLTNHSHGRRHESTVKQHWKTKKDKYKFALKMIHPTQHFEYVEHRMSGN